LVAPEILGFDDFIEIDCNFCPFHHFICFDLDQLQHQLLAVNLLLLEDGAQSIEILQEIEVIVDCRGIDDLIFRCAQ
jgi:hypothetical protein